MQKAQCKSCAFRIFEGGKMKYLKKVSCFLSFCFRLFCQCQPMQPVKEILTTGEAD